MINNNCNPDLVEQINGRLLERNNAYGNMDVLIGERSVPTKYVFPLQVAAPKCQQPVLKYDTTSSFNPGDKKGPWSGFISNINDESILRNQVYALQRSPQANYIPDTNSDLYNVTINPNTNGSHAEAIFPNLFNGNILPPQSNESKNEISNGLGNLFNNDTRQQLKDS